MHVTNWNRFSAPNRHQGPGSAAELTALILSPGVDLLAAMKGGIQKALLVHIPIGVSQWYVHILAKMSRPIVMHVLTRGGLHQLLFLIL